MKLKDYINEVKENKPKHWTVWDKITRKAIDLTHNEFKDGIENNWIKLTGEFKKVENSNMIWIDGILDK